jgi:predicted HNH restriction endonuclease
MIITNNHDNLEIIEKENLKDLANYFLLYFQEDSTFELEIKKIKSKLQYKYNFQIKDKNKVFENVFKKHNSHEFSLSLGKTFFTFTFRINHQYFSKNSDRTSLELNKSKTKKEGGESTIRLDSKQKIDELINFVFNKTLNYPLTKFKIKDVSHSNKIYQTVEKFEEELQFELEKIKKLTNAEIIKKLKESNPIPKKTIVTQNVFKRNPIVIYEILKRANGKCENCKKSSPFLKDKDNTPYLEVHHKIPLSENGEDTIENAIALCPNCHRHAHFGKKTY